MKDRLSPTEFAAQKALHARIRTDLHASAKGQLFTETAGFRERVPHRIMILIWAFARGLSYRRIESRRRVQLLGGGVVFEHNAPPLGFLQAEAEKYVPHATLDALKAWLDEPPIYKSGKCPACHHISTRMNHHPGSPCGVIREGGAVCGCTFGAGLPAARLLVEKGFLPERGDGVTRPSLGFAGSVLTPEASEPAPEP